MEARRSSTFKNAVGQQLTCSICQERVKNPKVLPCLHSFCKNCLQDWILHTSAVQFPCPNCKTLYNKPPNGAYHYPTNFTLANLVEVLEIYEAEEEKSKEIKCENGVDENGATCKCVDCEIYLCAQCQDVHERMKTTKGHRVLKLSQLKESRNLEYKRICSKHDGEELKLYCGDCCQVICRDCTIVDHKDHNNVDFIRTVQPSLESDLREHLGKVTEKSKEFEHHLEYLQMVQFQSNENIEDCKEKIKEYFEVYRQQLSEKERSLTNELDESKDDITNIISTEREEVEVSKAKLDSAASFTHQLLEKGIPVDIAMMHQQTRQRLTELQKEEWDHTTVQACRFTFVEDDTRKNPFNSRIRSGINPGEISVEKLEQPVPGENKFNVLLSPDMDSSKANVFVKIVKDGIEELGGVTSRETKSHVHEVTYYISEDGVYTYTISVDGITAPGSPFRRAWSSKLARGTVIRRGKDWKWGDQDKSKTNRGIILGWSGEVGASDKWVKVKWENNRQNNYRWGAEDCYDLEVVVADDSSILSNDIF